jgi:curved DNA-binding protein CbpA
MNYNDACIILDLSKNFTEKDLKQKYYMKALLYHPDKNKDSDANDRFREILEAYNYLNNYNRNNKNNKNNNLNTSDEKSYINILDKFLDGLLNKDTNIQELISIINNKYSELTIELLNHFSKSTLLRFNKFITEYSDILHINKDTLNKFNFIIKEHIKDDIIEIINPTLDNLINNDIYKLTYNSDIYYIPMWHHELIYELSNNLLIINCEPELPDYITLDPYNNLYVSLSTEVKSILKNDSIIINIGEKKYEIPINKLYIIYYQRYSFISEGISYIDTKNIYNIENRGNIYVDIYFTDLK